MSSASETVDSSTPASSPAGAASKMFASWPGEERVRGARDATLIAIGIVLIILGVLLANRTLRIETEISNVVGALPSWAHEGFIWSYGLGALFVLWVIFAAVLRRHPRWDIVFAAAIMYRVVTFLLPPIWGYFSLHWLQRNGYV